MAQRPFESRIQDLVYNIDVGLGLRLIQAGLAFLAVLLLMLVVTATQFQGLDNAEAMDYAQLGRNLMQQKRFATQYIRPLSLALYRNRTGRPAAQIGGHLDLMHAPVYPALLAGGFYLGRGSFRLEKKPTGVYPPEQWVIVPINHLFVLLTGIVLLLLARRLFGFRTAALSVTAYFLSLVVWKNSIAGVGLPVVGFFALLAWYAALQAVGRRAVRPDWAAGWGWLAVSAAASGLAILTRYAAVVLVPGIALFVGLQFGRRAWRWAAAYAVVALLVVSPWIARNVKVSGRPLGLAPYTAFFESRVSEGDNIERTAVPPKLSLSDQARALWIKWMTRMPELGDRKLRQFGNGLLFAFFLSALFYRFVRRDVHVFRWCVTLSMALLVLLAGFLGESAERLLDIFWPVVIVYGLAFFFLLLERLQFPIRLLNISVTGAVIALTALPLVFAVLPPRTGVPYPPYYPPYIRHVSEMLEPNEVMVTDMPWAVAWYGNRYAIHLPPSLEDFYQINDYYQRVSGIYFTTITRNRPYVRMLKMHATYKTWFPILEGRIPGEFPLAHGFQLNNLDQFFLTDRPRWTERR